VSNLDWPPIIEHAAAIVRSYDDTGVTLRQLFYRLVADGSVPNLKRRYTYLSELTAEGRRQGTFPDLIDRTSRIEAPETFDGPDDARGWLRDLYRRDRTEGQEWTIVLGVEKAGLSAQLNTWFTGPLGIPRVAFGGYASQTLCDQVARHLVRLDRPALLIYAGDFDPTGEDIDRDFEHRVGVFTKVIRVALNSEQIDQYQLPENVLDPEAVQEKLRKDPRAAAFEARHGNLVQYEVDALPPDTLRDLYRNAVDEFWDDDAYRAVLAREAAERGQL
jgi:hypothetical protein